MTTTPLSLIYTSVVSHERVWIALMTAVLNELDILADIGNTYLNTDCREKVVCLTAGTEFGF